ncbi:N-alpha-acetyltransferase 50 [Rhodotorula toruloides]|nr:N-alpha-acetyltransferase 50 [Rhodotorula toruloides]
MSAVLSALPDLPKLVEPITVNGKRLRVAPRVNLGYITPNNLGTVKKLHNVLFPISFSSQFYDDLLDQSQHPEDYNKLVFYQDLPVGVIVCRLEEEGGEVPKTLSEAAGKGKAVEGQKEAKADEEKTYRLYVMTLGVLAPYRNQGLGSKLIHHVLTTAAESLAQPHPSPSSVTPPSKPSAPAAPAAKGKKAAPPPPQANGKKEADKKDEKAEEKEPPKPRVSSVYLHVHVANEEGRQFWEKWGFEVKTAWSNLYEQGKAVMTKLQPTITLLLAYASYAAARPVDYLPANTVARYRKPILGVASALTIGIVGFTGVAIMPLNRRMQKMEREASVASTAQADSLIGQWVRLHAVRIALGTTAFALAVSELALA